MMLDRRFEEKKRGMIERQFEQALIEFGEEAVRGFCSDRVNLSRIQKDLKKILENGKSKINY